MSIEAAIAYLEHTRMPAEQGGGVDGLRAAVQQAATQGFAFSLEELRSTLAVRDMLDRVRRDPSLRRELIAAKKPLSLLIDRARQAGHDLDRSTAAQVLRALRARAGELHGEALDQVVGGTSRLALPDVDDEVLVAFVQGDIHSPFVIGSLWGGKDKPPAE
jgi:uncharacterized protein involved in type VI secretion and phage assembly